ncbi:hypothetical protein TSTA_019710 [Talaromyces stipitatus ATCC 10500]|uniref:Uncharacterized protein n=1 Tax=Talaromyces stipitatus (strain ATCC 10500 / CBS 375.48 / QM 6759 / NRRL 1006) TaxID=441959 RepID=B8MEM7_TALSN|nr:uncharacterized protein TSTA_019710 [Talaromyces stipitatus ATCC 10500]EED16910.1 hypothetical protein TSTA_019710 [Talaromyces stipitatus ATCC 10500]
MSQPTGTTTTQERSQPWQAMQEVQTLFKPAMSAANAESGADASSQRDMLGEKPLKLNLFRENLNSATTNIADVVEEKH